MIQMIFLFYIIDGLLINLEEMIFSCGVRGGDFFFGKIMVDIPKKKKKKNMAQDIC